MGPTHAPMRTAPTPEIHAPAPFTVQAPSTHVEFRNEILSAIDRRFETFSEQMSCLVGDQRRPTSPSAEVQMERSYGVEVVSNSIIQIRIVLGTCGAFLRPPPHDQGEMRETSHLTSRREKAISLVLDPLFE